ncbi:hypothetical protein [Mycoplasmopsis cynos]|uniref:hypothetical protein n=1 Tax=Mycoplasmopsis cynos TaxID=171284 RepID=UPI00220678AB|nr:hypothetical protein [Mycoplasmopsis cynos]UWV81808.1 hypothetical protein NW065_01500 [Mycoplasmopsis cynos]
MKTISKEKLVNIVSSLMMIPTDKVIENILQNWNTLQKNLRFFDEVDLDNLGNDAYRWIIPNWFFKGWYWGWFI